MHYLFENLTSYYEVCRCEFFVTNVIITVTNASFLFEYSRAARFVIVWRLRTKKETTIRNYLNEQSKTAETIEAIKT